MLPHHAVLNQSDAAEVPGFDDEAAADEQAPDAEGSQSPVALIESEGVSSPTLPASMQNSVSGRLETFNRGSLVVAALPLLQMQTRNIE